MREYYLRGRRTVAIHSSRAPAKKIDKPVKLRLGMMKPTGTRPSIRATEYGTISVLSLNTS